MTLVADCLSGIWIHGLNSHPLGGWASKHQRPFLWVRDELAKSNAGKRMRCILYGYDNKLVNNPSFQDIDGLGHMLEGVLFREWRESIQQLIFFAHSLGGIILKSALRLAAAYQRLSLLRKIKSIVFFGVPNYGMETSHLLPMVKGQPNEYLIIKHLEKNSPSFKKLDDSIQKLSAFWDSPRFVCFYEQMPTKTPVKDSSGRCKMQGEETLLVPKSSAFQPGTEARDFHPINSDHSNIANWRGAASKAYYCKILPRHLSSSSNNGNNSRKPEGDSEDIRKGLHFQAQTAIFRIGTIDEAAWNTCQWIWDDSLPMKGWLSSRDPIFWISGKPGSGKSTLMKYIAQVIENEKVPVGDGTEPLVLSQFSFYYAGEEAQRSSKGLLYTLLSQCLESFSHLVDCIRPIYSICEGKWSTNYLIQALDCIISQKDQRFGLLIILDALDECSDPWEDLMELINHIIRSSREGSVDIKICLSSRPQNFFRDAFRSYPTVEVHKHTVGDMYKYIMAEFDNPAYPGMESLLIKDDNSPQPALPELVSRLVEQAEGVFLWVRLTVNGLLKYCQETPINSISDLFDQYELETPYSTIEQTYGIIVREIPAECKREAFIMLETVYRSGMLIDSNDFWLVLECAKQKSFQGCVDSIPTRACVRLGKDVPEDQFYNPFEYASFVENWRSNRVATFEELTWPAEKQDRYLNKVCGDLIERRRTEKLFGSAAIHGDFVKRETSSSVRLRQATIIDLLRQDLSVRDISNLNGYTFLSKYGLAQLVQERERCKVEGYTSLPTWDPFLPSWFIYLHYFHLAESTTGMSQKAIIDDADEIYQAFDHSRDEHDVYGLYSSPYAFGAAMNMVLYINGILEESDPGLVKELLGYGTENTPTLIHIVA
ncbi:small s protein [Fusarium austroafricanum]|uniref:Small s protein n=1 Tax=Fusarium austroafricanum TaxID=2364996 RepID=A0A8H4KVG6_9HYPO|nr:small s protein [Fusarium austroafricanum]